MDMYHTSKVNAAGLVRAKKGDLKKWVTKIKQNMLD
jgi:hypothetical protein